MKITDSNYSLPIIEALSPHELFTSGANKPLLITGVDINHGSKADYVVKLRGAERMSFEANMRELLAAFIAMEMEIPVVNPAIINISNEFVELLKDDEAWQYASKSIGYNFGSKYIKDYIVLPINQRLNNVQLFYAQTIFAFDVLIQNADRRTDKPNMLTDGKQIIILDHELAFGFIFDLFQNHEPWLIKDNNLHWIRNHCLLSKIQGVQFDYDAFAESLDNLDNNFWQAAWNLIPDEWHSNHFDIIRNHIIAISENRNSFITELKKLMS